MVHIPGCDSGACVCCALYVCVYTHVAVYVCFVHVGLLGGRFLERRCGPVSLPEVA